MISLANNSNSLKTKLEVKISLDLINFLSENLFEKAMFVNLFCNNLFITCDEN
jgi:hypothetical protein